MRGHSPTIVIAPDSFKGSVTAPQAASAIAEGLLRVWPRSDLRLCPMADGGEGTLDAVLSQGGRRLTARVSGASAKAVDAGYGIVGEGGVAIEDCIANAPRLLADRSEQIARVVAAGLCG